ncbi:uncharacterized protein [Aegilops tauschii subsp. strangulata]|uniref:uncharacterized protein n=1 Tax=Aegilops tauschii subsp. strangulata TaxID=200361 RepID=UPI003CC8B1EE
MGHALTGQRTLSRPGSQPPTNPNLHSPPFFPFLAAAARHGALQAAAHEGTGAARAPGAKAEAVAARAPASSDPGYMRPTSSSGARAGREAAAATSTHAAQPVVAKAALVGSTPRAARPTCASAQKSGGGGCEGHRACRYAYCSFKGHAPAAPPLGAFLASRSRA